MRPSYFPAHILLFLAALLPAGVSAQSQPATKPLQHIILIGDAGELTATKHHTVVEAVEKTEPMDKHTTVIYLGDNIYRYGLPFEDAPDYLAMKAVIDTQINIVNHGPGMVYFIPGNHDWMNGQPGGYDAAIRQERYIEGLRKRDVVYLPRDGCPGPEEVDLGNDVTLVIINSQWFVHRQAKPGIESDCDAKTTEEIYSQLQDIVTRNYRKLIIFACHHPFKSNGVHGGYYTIKQHIFPFTEMNPKLYIPLPILGSIYPISRSVFGSSEDIAFPEYTNMINGIDGILKGHPNVIHVAGHEHALQWITDSSSNYIGSGSGCKTQRVSKSRKSKFIAAELGWVDLEIYADKTVTATFHGPTDSGSRVLYTDTVLNYAKLPPQPQPDTTKPLAVYGDTALVAASHQYDDASGLRLVLDGRNYRQEWSTPVTLRVFHMNDTKGGFKIIGAGGGMETKTLHLADKNDRRYNLRTIDKDPRKVLPQGLRETFARDFVQDMISAAHPYAPMVVWPLANAAGIVTPKPEFFFVADDPALGYYRPLFANKVCMLEPADPTLDGTKSKSTAKVINKIIGEDDHFVNQHAVLQARLLDMLIGDWDRNLDQWRWGVSDTGRGKLYYPIPRDRDQAFFLSDGLVMKFASQRRLPWMAGFHKDFHRFKWLSHQARDFDRLFLNELTEEDWRAGIKAFQKAETDDAITDAVGAMPKPIVGIRGALIAQKLRSRRDELAVNGMKYYKFISRKVNILGSNRPEVFNVKQTDSGILVQVYAREDGGRDTSLLRYQRVFQPRRTNEIRLYGFGGADKFVVDKNVRTDMRIRMIGGGGADTFDIAGKAHSHIYDVTSESNVVLAHRHTRNEFSADPNVNNYNVQDFQYSFLRLPTIQLGYNPDDGAMAGLGVWRRTYNFRKDPYESDNRINTLFAIARKAFEISYRGAFIHTAGPFDVLVDADLQRPALRNFFGYGNQTPDTADISFYRARYNFLSADALLQKRLFGILRAGIGPVYNYYSNHEYSNQDKVLQNPELVHLDSADIYSHKQYLGGKAFFDINSLNNELFPTRGISWHGELNALQPIAGDAKPYTELHTDMDVYASLSNPAKLVAVLRFGGGHIFSKDFEFFQSMSVGQNNFLRGFRRDRFSGRSMAYNSVELRAKLFDVKSYLLPGAFGLVGFNDVARVWSDGEISRKWHDAYGAGFYYIPYNMFIISATAGFSPEGNLFSVTLGTKLNLAF